MSLVRLERVAKFYGSKPVFRDADFSLEPGKTLLVVGPNGAGKSTLLKIIAGLIPADAGTVSVPQDAVRIGYLGHKTFLYKDMTGLENLRFWAKLYRLSLDDTALEEVLERMGLKFAAQENAGGYSRGMAQRLNLARVFMLAHDLILLDEPDTGLDVRSLGILEREISAAKDNGAALIRVGHNIERDLAGADCVLSIQNRKAHFFASASDFTPEAVQ